MTLCATLKGSPGSYMIGNEKLNRKAFSVWAFIWTGKRHLSSVLWIVDCNDLKRSFRLWSSNLAPWSALRDVKCSLPSLSLVTNYRQVFIYILNALLCPYVWKKSDEQEDYKVTYPVAMACTRWCNWAKNSPPSPKAGRLNLALRWDKTSVRTRDLHSVAFPHAVMSTTRTDTITHPSHPVRLRLHLRPKNETNNKFRKKIKWLPLAADALTFKMEPFENSKSALATPARVIEETWSSVESESSSVDDFVVNDRQTRHKKKCSRPRATRELLDRYPVCSKVRGLQKAPPLTSKLATRWAEKFENQWNTTCNRHLPSIGRTSKPELKSLKRRHKKSQSKNMAPVVAAAAIPCAISSEAVNDPSTLRHALNRDQINTPHEYSLAILLLDIQDRDITPEDYDVLMRLDDVVAPKTLSEADIQRLSTAKVTTRKAGNQCPVCLEAFRSEELYMKLPCDHEFHKNCIEQWLFVNSNTCPLDGLPVKTWRLFKQHNLFSKFHSWIEKNKYFDKKHSIFFFTKMCSWHGHW